MTAVKREAGLFLHDLVTVLREYPPCYATGNGKALTDVMIFKSGNLPFIIVQEIFSRSRVIDRTEINFCTLLL